MYYKVTFTKKITSSWENIMCINVPKPYKYFKFIQLYFSLYNTNILFKSNYSVKLTETSYNNKPFFPFNTISDFRICHIETPLNFQMIDNPLHPNRWKSIFPPVIKHVHLDVINLSFLKKAGKYPIQKKKERHKNPIHNLMIHGRKLRKKPPVSMPTGAPKNHKERKKQQIIFCSLFSLSFGGIK